MAPRISIFFLYVIKIRQAVPTRQCKFSVSILGWWVLSLLSQTVMLASERCFENGTRNVNKFFHFEIVKYHIHPQLFCTKSKWNRISEECSFNQCQKYCCSQCNSDSLRQDQFSPNTNLKLDFNKKCINEELFNQRSNSRSNLLAFKSIGIILRKLWI